VRLHVIADDLTGACDVGAALLPWPVPVVVSPDGRAGGDDGDRLVIRNTQSRTLPPALAARRVREALAGSSGDDGIVLKKIDTGLRGHLGAELEAAMGAIGARRAFVLPAIPEVGRTTVGGEQRIDGVPVHRTAFADDPHNPVRESQVGAVIARGSDRRTTTVTLDALRGPDGPGPAIDATDASIVVLDAETEADLAAGVGALLRRPRPLLLVGSTGLARALRAALGPGAAPAPAPVWPVSGRGTLVVVGSAHPVARAQRDRARAAGVLQDVITVEPAAARAAGARAAALLAAGRTVGLVAPDVVTPGQEAAVGAALRTATVTAIDGCLPAGLVIVGGETAYEVLAGLGHPAIVLDGRAAPLAVRGRIATGPYRGVAIVTKGGSSGAPGLLASLARRPEGAAA
jgi:uncharacterized protein YgbK (DUF1537 family)